MLPIFSYFYQKSQHSDISTVDFFGYIYIHIFISVLYFYFFFMSACRILWIVCIFIFSWFCFIFRAVWKFTAFTYMFIRMIYLLNTENLVQLKKIANISAYNESISEIVRDSNCSSFIIIVLHLQKAINFCQFKS